MKKLLGLISLTAIISSCNIVDTNQLKEQTQINTSANRSYSFSKPLAYAYNPNSGNDGWTKIGHQSRTESKVWVADNRVITGIEVGVNRSHDVATLRVNTAIINKNTGRLAYPTIVKGDGSKPDGGVEVNFDYYDQNRVITGISMGVNNRTDFGSFWVDTRRVYKDPATGKITLVDHKREYVNGMDGNAEMTIREIDTNNQSTAVLTGLGYGCYINTLTTTWYRVAHIIQ